MRRRPWIIEPPLLIAIGVGLIVYVIAAECLSVGLDGPLLPGTRHLEQRLWECMLLWLVATFAVGWIRFARDRRPASNAAVWPIVVVPLAAALWLSAAIAWREYDFFRHSPAAYRPLVWWSDVGIPLAIVAFPLVAALAGSYALVTQARLWRLPFTAGRCPVCGYDLTGNVSGRCPECGEEITTDPSVPREFYGRHHYWLPELAFFPNARVRYTAWMTARKAYQNTTLYSTALLTLGVGCVCLLPGIRARFGAFICPVVMPLMATTVICQTWLARRFLRRAMRRQLRACGRCDRCGEPLTDSKCTVCEQ